MSEREENGIVYNPRVIKYLDGVTDSLMHEVVDRLQENLEDEGRRMVTMADMTGVLHFVLEGCVRKVYSDHLEALSKEELTKND